MRVGLIWAMIALNMSVPATGKAPSPHDSSSQHEKLSFDLSEARDAREVRAVAAKNRATSQPIHAVTMERPRSEKFQSPAAEMPVGSRGATLGVGALGSRHRGVPKLAHIVLDWDF